jgi:hypothetical protein
MEVKPLERLDGPIFADSPRNPLNQFLTVGLHPLCVTFVLLVIDHIHRNLPTYFAIPHLEVLQNQTIICDDYSTSPCYRVSIITAWTENIPRSFDRADWTFLQEGITAMMVGGGFQAKVHHNPQGSAL